MTASDVRSDMIFILVSQGGRVNSSDQRLCEMKFVQLEVDLEQLVHQVQHPPP